MARKSHLTTAEFAILNDACIPVAEAFDSHPYLVGSATERADYRDVDLRLILMDEEFDRLFDEASRHAPQPDGNASSSSRWRR